MDGPHFGAKLVTRNMWHSCDTFFLDALFAKSEPNGRKAFDALSKSVTAATADVTIVPQMTRAVFQLRTRFISVHPRKDHLLAGFNFTEKMPHARFVKVEGPSPAPTSTTPAWPRPKT